MFIEADSVHVKLKTLYNVVNTPENLFAAEYIRSKHKFWKCYRIQRLKQLLQ